MSGTGRRVGPAAAPPQSDPLEELAGLIALGLLVDPHPLGLTEEGARAIARRIVGRETIKLWLRSGRARL